MGGKHWTEKEDKILISNAPGKTAYELADILGCSHYRIRARTYRLGIKIRRHVGKRGSTGRKKMIGNVVGGHPNRRWLPWTEYELRHLKSLLEDGYSYREICKKFPHRSEIAIHSIAHAHGFKSALPRPGHKKWHRGDINVIKVYGDRLNTEEIKKYFLPNRSIHDIWMLKRYYEKD